MKEIKFKPIVRQLLRDFGLQPSDIPHRGLKTPDFEAKGKNSMYTIELKIKGDDPKEIARDSKVLAQGEVLSKEIPTGPRNKLYAVITKGTNQMIEHDPTHKTFHIIWVHSTGNNAELLNRRFRSTLFGMQNVFSTERSKTTTCYYFNESSFFSHKDSLDGAILTCGDTLQLCVNTLSFGYGKFKTSDLYKALSKGLCDPAILEQREGAMIADCNIDRKNSELILEYLRKKYGLNHLQTIDLKQCSAMMLIPKDSQGCD